MMKKKFAKNPDFKFEISHLVTPTVPKYWGIFPSKSPNFDAHLEYIQDRVTPI